MKIHERIRLGMSLPVTQPWSSQKLQSMQKLTQKEISEIMISQNDFIEYSEYRQVNRCDSHALLMHSDILAMYYVLPF